MMNPIIKHTLKSVIKNKVQAAVITITVVLVTALLFAALSLSDVFYAMNANEQARQAADSHMLLGEIDYYSPTFSLGEVEALIEPSDLENADYFWRFKTVMKTEHTSKSVLVEATDLENYLSNHTIRFAQTANLKDLDEGILPAIMGKTLARLAGIRAGDSVGVYLSSIRDYVTLTITHIAEDEGIFATALTLNILADFYAIGNRTQINSAYFRFVDSSLFSKYQAIFNQSLPNVPAVDAQTNDYALEVSKNSTMLMSIGVIFIIAAMMLILLTSYLIIARHRMGDMVIFKSLGATPKQVTLIMLLEVLVYALFGSLVGLVLGRIFVGAAVDRLLPTGGFIIKYQLWKYLGAFLTSVAVCVVACLIPIIRAGKKSIRDLTSSGQKIAKKPNPLLALVSILMLVAALVSSEHLSGIFVIALIVFFIVACSFFISSLAPLIKWTVAFIYKKLRVSGGLLLSGLSSARCKGTHNVSVLLIAVIVFSFAMVEVTNVVKLASTSYLSRYSADYVVVCDNNKSYEEFRQINDNFLAVEGISDSYFMTHTYFRVPDSDDGFSIYGVDSETLQNCTKNELGSQVIEMWEKTENPIVLSMEMVIRYNLKIGDTVSFEWLSYGQKDAMFDFVLVGIDRTVTEWDYVGFSKYSSVDLPAYRATYFVFALEDVNMKQTFLLLRDAAENMHISVDGQPQRANGMYALEYEEWSNLRLTHGGLNSLLTFLQMFLLGVSFLGIINISVVTVYDRRHEFILYRLSGMDPALFIRFSFFEGLLTALTAAAMGLILCLCSNMLLPSVALIINRFLDFGILPLRGFAIIGILSSTFLFAWLLIALFNRPKPDSINQKYSF